MVFFDGRGGLAIIILSETQVKEIVCVDSDENKFVLLNFSLWNFILKYLVAVQTLPYWGTVDWLRNVFEIFLIFALKSRRKGQCLICRGT